ncbi:hypothetical protein Tco_0907915 [Tanacetum coccineum]|uniref:Uncharacterized protein n=1 Tax=Tanacetum coccineum TaxID=301880 RepID=A0ABQ5CLS7_9ASTR
MVSRGGQPPKTTAVVAAEPTVTTTAAPGWCRACGGDYTFTNFIVVNLFWLEPKSDKERPEVEKIADISQPVNVIEEEEESVEDDYELKRIEKGKEIEETPIFIQTPRTPNPETAKGESSAPRRSTAGDLVLQDTLQVSLVEQKSHEELETKQNVEKVKEHLMAKEIKIPEVEKITDISQPMNVIEEEEESAEDDYELKRMEKGKEIEESRNTPSLTTTRSLRTHSTLISSDTEKL